MRRLALVTVLSLIGMAASAQFRTSGYGNRSNNQGSDQGVLSRFYFAGGGGFGSGTNTSGLRYTYYALLPVIGYKVNQQVMVGTGITYQHYGYPDNNLSIRQFGVSPFVRYTINPVFFQAEYNLISSPTVVFKSNQMATLDYNSRYHSRLLLGIGYRMGLGQRSAINALLMYDILYSVPSVFNSPVVVRVFFSF